MGNSSNDITNVIWIDPNIDNGENSYYLEELENIKNTKINWFKNIEDALILIKKLKFLETTIIISGSLYTEFIKKFEENLTDIFIIPKIIIFTLNKEKFLENNKIYNDKYNSFYNLGGIQTSFTDIKNFLLKPLPKLLNKKDIIEEQKLTFEYIDCKEKLILPLLYQSLIEITSADNVEKYTQYLFKKYSTNKDINKLLNSIKDISDIPIELLSKYYTRLYTIESQFYYDINTELRGKEKDKYITFIKLLYEGLKLKSLPLASNNILYRGSKISNDEIIKIKEFLKNKKKDLPGAIVFSKSFLSFSKDINIAKQFLNNNNNKDNESKVLFIIEKDDKIDYSLSTHSDIENISIHPHEREVLFFPFSSFEIQEINEKILNNERIYEIKLLFLGKYLKLIENIDKKIPDSIFKKEMLELGLIPETKLERAKEIINHYKEFRDNIERNNSNKTRRKRKESEEDNKNNANIETNNEINITYNVENENDIHIFGKNFVENNKDKCKIEFENKEYEIKECFHIEDYTNYKLNKLQIKLKLSKNITDMSYMFNGCTSLTSLPDISNWNTNNVTNMSYMFYHCKSLISLPDISKWNTNNVTNMSYMFNDCKSLQSLPDISKWNTNNVINMSCIFACCLSLPSLPDISKWNTKNVTNMSIMFSDCKSLTSLPDISKWNTNNVTNMSYMFYNCKSLKSLPDISKWNTNNVRDMSYMFCDCKSLASLPDISKWNTNNVTDMSNMFNGCKEELKIPKKFN